MANILLIEDERAIAELLKYGLEKEGFTAQMALTGKEGLLKIEAAPPDVLLLDLMLPDMDGLDICRFVTGEKNIPIIILSAKNDQVDKLIGLEYGADDYITKPFDIREVILRVKSILRRIERTRNGEGEGGILRVADVAVDLDRHEVYKGERRVELTPKEFALLEILMRSPGRVFKRGELLEKVWEFEYMGDTRTVDIHIQRLRKKLQDDRFIRTVFGVGYKVAEEEAQ